jgi:hypothetical protein
MSFSIRCVDARGEKHTLQFNGDWTCEIPDDAVEFTLYAIFSAFPARERGEYAVGQAIGLLDSGQGPETTPPYELRVESKDFDSLRKLYMGIRAGELSPTISFEKPRGPNAQDLRIKELEQKVAGEATQKDAAEEELRRTKRELETVKTKCAELSDSVYRLLSHISWAMFDGAKWWQGRRHLRILIARAIANERLLMRRMSSEDEQALTILLDRHKK